MPTIIPDAQDADDSVELDARKRLSRDGAEEHESSHHRNQKVAGIRGADAQHTLIEQGYEQDPAEHPNGCEDAHQRHDRELIPPEQLERNDWLAREAGFLSSERDQHHPSADKRGQDFG
jgi:hypothetical protein